MAENYWPKIRGVEIQPWDGDPSQMDSTVKES